MIRRITVHSSNPPTIECEASESAWYIRFKSARVAKTLHQDKPGVVVTIDLDSKGDVVGVELLGVREFSIQLLMRIAKIDAPKIDFTRARFVRASDRELVES